MKSKTSFFNLSLLRKDLVRFAPAWALYGAYLLLMFGGSVISDNQASMATILADSLVGFSFGNFFYAMVCAQLLFGDLFQSRLCNALHALPIRRESWFATHLVAGLLFAAIPVAITGTVFLAVLGDFWMAALLWMAGLMLQFLFCFAVATLSIMLVGNRFAAVVVYTILNFLSAIGLWLFTYLYQPHFYGFLSNEADFLRLSPVLWMVQFDWFNASGVSGRLTLGEGWGYLGICTAVALVLLAVALVLYRKRPLEKAGDFIVFGPTAPVFLVLYTFSAGTAFHLFSELFVATEIEFLFLLVGLAIGFFTGLMLLQRTIRVFRAKAFARFGILMGIFGLTLLLTIVDPFGITRWVPEQKDVKWAAVNYYSMTDMEAHAFDADDQAILAEILSIHQHGVDHPEAADNGKSDVRVTISYGLKSGQTVRRQYYIDLDSLAAVTLKHVLSQPEILFGSQYQTAEDLLDAMESMEIQQEKAGIGYRSEKITDREKLAALTQALYADAQAGNLCQLWDFLKDEQTPYELSLQGEAQRNGNGYFYNEYWYLSITESATNTMAWIEENLE